MSHLSKRDELVAHGGDRDEVDVSEEVRSRPRLSANELSAMSWTAPARCLSKVSVGHAHTVFTAQGTVDKVSHHIAATLRQQVVVYKRGHQ